MKFSKDEFGANLRAARARADMSQEQLANRAGLSASSIIGYENGTMVPGVDKAYAIAQALGCTPNDLMGWNTDEAA